MSSGEMEGQGLQKPAKNEGYVGKFLNRIKSWRKKGDQEGKPIEEQFKELADNKVGLEAQDQFLEGSGQEAWGKALQVNIEKHKAALAGLDNSAFVDFLNRKTSDIFQNAHDLADNNDRNRSAEINGELHALFENTMRRSFEDRSQGKTSYAKAEVALKVFEAFVDLKGLSGKGMGNSISAAMDNFKFIHQEIEKDGNLMGPQTKDQYNNIAVRAGKYMERLTPDRPQLFKSEPRA